MTSQPPPSPSLFDSCYYNHSTYAWERGITVAFIVFGGLLSCYHMWLIYREMHYAYSLRDKLLSLITIPVMLGVTTICQMYATTVPVPPDVFDGYVANDFYVDLMGFLRAWYLYQAITHDMGLFNLGSGGGFLNTSEAVQKLGAWMEEAELPEVAAIPWCLVPFWGRRTIKPNTDFLNNCVTRMRLVVAATLAIIFIDMTLQPYNRSDRIQNLELAATNPFATQDSIWNYAEIYFGILNILFAGILMSAKFPLDNVLHRFLLTGHQHCIFWRNVEFVIFVGIIGGAQGIVAAVSINITPICTWWPNHQWTFTATELLIIAVVQRRAWVPPYGGWIKTRNDFEQMFYEATSAESGSYKKTRELTMRAEMQAHFIIPSEDVKAVFNGEMTIDEAAKKHREQDPYFKKSTNDQGGADQAAIEMNALQEEPAGSSEPSEQHITQV